MKEYDLGRHEAQIVTQSEAGSSQVGRERFAPEPTGDAHEDGRPDRAERYGRALDHHSEHDRGGRREAQGHQQGCGHGRGRAESGRALDERPE